MKYSHHICPANNQQIKMSFCGKNCWKNLSKCQKMCRQFFHIKSQKDKKVGSVPLHRASYRIGILVIGCHSPPPDQASFVPDLSNPSLIFWSPPPATAMREYHRGVDRSGGRDNLMFLKCNVCHPV